MYITFRRVDHKLQQEEDTAKNRIKSARGEWKPGQEVRVGSLALIVNRKVETPEGEPDAFLLDSYDRTRHYQFQAFRGVRRVA
jgi:hypothetical protein